MHRSCLTLCASAILLLSAACASRRPAIQASAATIQPIDAATEGDRVWDVSQEVLRRNRFRLDRVDRAAGIITTLPTTSQHFTEFWRRDVRTFHDLVESSVNPIRRWVEVRLTGDDEGRWTGVDVVVHKERLSSPDRQFNSTAAAFAYFGTSLPSTTGDEQVLPSQDQWLDRGRDPALESYLISEICRRGSLDAEPATQSAE